MVVDQFLNCFEIEIIHFDQALRAIEGNEYQALQHIHGKSQRIGKEFKEEANGLRMSEFASSSHLSDCSRLPSNLFAASLDSLPIPL